MTSGSWSSRIDKGAVWRRTLRYQDANGLPIDISAPGYMDLRTKPDDEAPRIARIDSTGSAAGMLTFPEPGAVTLELLDEETRLLPPGRFYYDLFVTDSTGEYIRLVYGVMTVVPAVSVAS